MPQLGAALTGAERGQENTDPLKRTFSELENICKLPCYNPNCEERQRFCSNGIEVTDNARVACFIQIWETDFQEVPEVRNNKTEAWKEKTPQELFQHNNANSQKPLHIEIRCKKCKRLAGTINAQDTVEKLYLDIRSVLSNDKTVPLLYKPHQTNSLMPDDAKMVCELAHRPVLDRFCTAHLLQNLATIAESLEKGELYLKLKEKGRVAEKKFKDERKTYIRIGLGLQDLEPHTAVLELWPAGYKSPIHHHGGCAGSVRVLCGRLKCKLFDSILDEDPITFKRGDCELQSLPEAGTDTLVLSQGQTTWLNRQNWYVHQVQCHERDSFAMSVHIYKSCTDEFAFAKGGNDLAKGSPSNDYFWDIDLGPEHPKVKEIGTDDSNDLRDFTVEVLQRPKLRQALKKTSGYDEEVDDLFQKERDYFNKSRYDRTLLHFAAEGHNRYYAEKLMQKGLKADAKDTEGWTPFGLAVQRAIQSEDSANTFVKFLLDSGASPDSIAKRVDGQDVSVGKWAAQGGAWSVYETLRAKGAQVALDGEEHQAYRDWKRQNGI